MNIRQMLCPSSKYDTKCPYPMTGTRVVTHNTANDASAGSEVSYMVNNGNECSFHYAADDKEVVQGIPENRNAWHAGDGNGKGNREGISVEICYSLSGGSRFTAAEKNGAQLIAWILRCHGWGMDKVTKHQDYSGKHCPDRTLNLGWQRFLNMVQAELSNMAQVWIDTTGTYNMSHGGQYIIKTTYPFGTPNLWAGSAGVVDIVHQSRTGNDDFWKVTGTGKSGSGTGIFVAAPGESGTKRLIINIK